MPVLGHWRRAGTSLDQGLKLFARLRGICQLEGLLDALLQQAPPAFSLPMLANTLEAGSAVAPPPVAKKKAPQVCAGLDGATAWPLGVWAVEWHWARLSALQRVQRLCATIHTCITSSAGPTGSHRATTVPHCLSG